jgi:hypothetical protein
MINTLKRLFFAKRSFALSVGFPLIMVALFPVSKIGSVSAPKNAGDSIRRESKIREVLTSQQLFLVELTEIKGKSKKKKFVNFKAELRDAFMIICYDNDKSFKEQDWAMCPAGKCPTPGTYNWGTPAYKQLDTLMAEARKKELTLKKRIDSMKVNNPKRAPVKIKV